MRGIATMLGIDLKTVKSSLQRLRGYQPLPEYYQDTIAILAPMQIAAHTEDELLMSDMAKAGYTKAEINTLFGHLADASVLRCLFKEAQDQNKFGNYRTSYGLLAYKVKTYLNQPKSDQPITWEELERQMSEISDPLEGMTPDYLRENAYSGRVSMVTYKTHKRLLAAYGPDGVLEVLRQLPHLPHEPLKQITCEDFQELLEQQQNQNTGIP